MSRRRRRQREGLDAVFSPTPLTDRLIKPSTEPFGSLREIEDRRSFHPDPSPFGPPARSVWGHPVQPVVQKRPPPGRPYRSPFHKLSFAVPKETAICVRRETRREVLFAKKRAGGGSRKKPHRNFYSSISCKR